MARPRSLAGLLLVVAALDAAGARTQEGTPVPEAAGADAKAVPLRLAGFRFFVSGAGSLPPPGWTEPGFDDHAWAGPATGAIAPRPPAALAAAPPAGVTLYDAVAHAPLLLRGRFDLDSPARVRVLELRVAYGDGFVAWINGREVARRGVGPGPATRALWPHGPEVERVYVPVPPEAAPRLESAGNLLAVEVLASPGRSAISTAAPAAVVDLAAASGVRIVRGPYLLAPAETRHGASVKVAWETDLPAVGAVTVEGAGGARPGAAAAPMKRLAARAPATRQVVTVGNLPRGQRLSYRIAVEAAPGDAAASESHGFATLPAPPAPMRFAVYGDMRYPGHAAHRAVVEALAREAPALVFNTGDLTDVGSEEANWQRYFEITAPLGAIAPVVPALGNHDASRANAGADLTWRLFGLPSAAPPGTPPGWTSLDLGGVHFVVLNTNEMTNPAQRIWLADDLARARRHHARAIFAFCHEGPWAHGLHGSSSTMIRDYAPLLAAGHVDVLFSGHDHMYERGVGSTPSGPLTYVVTGGGGAPLYNPSCRALTGPPPGDVPRPLPPCPSSVAVLTKTYNYVMVEVAAAGITVCPRRPDGTAVEPCFSLPARAR
jgi:acid phosphatase type 7